MAETRYIVRGWANGNHKFILNRRLAFEDKFSEEEYRQSRAAYMELLARRDIGRCEFTDQKTGEVSEVKKAVVRTTGRVQPKTYRGRRAVA